MTAAWTNTEDEAAGTAKLDADYTYLKVGYKSGEHAVAVDLAKGDDQAARNDEADMFGIGYVNTPKPWAELYIGAKVHSLDRPGSTFEDITIVTAGTRLKF